MKVQRDFFDRGVHFLRRSIVKPGKKVNQKGV